MKKTTIFSKTESTEEVRNGCLVRTTKTFIKKGKKYIPTDTLHTYILCPNPKKKTKKK